MERIVHFRTDRIAHMPVVSLSLQPDETCQRMGKQIGEARVNVAVVNAHPAECKGLVALLAEGGYQVVLEVPHGEALFEALAEGHVVHLVVLEVSASVPGGYSTLERLCTEHPEVRVLAFAHAPTDTDVMRTYRTGGRALLARNAGPDELYRALDAVWHVGIFHTAATHRLVLDNPDGLSQEERNRQRLLAKLPPRGKEVLERICRNDDLTYEYIGQELKIGKRTVETHVNHLFEVFGVRSKTALALCAVRWGLVAFK